MVFIEHKIDIALAKQWSFLILFGYNFQQLFSTRHFFSWRLAIVLKELCTFNKYNMLIY